MGNDLREKEREGTQPSRGFEHVAMAVLLFLIVGTLVFGIASLSANVRLPFTRPLQGSTNAQRTSSFSETDTKQPASVQDSFDAQQQEQFLKGKDTDGDTLTDYDELRMYHTSPYVKDTDSDGYDDKTEVATGHDPTCPSGKVCKGAEPFVQASTSSIPFAGRGLSDLSPSGNSAQEQARMQQALAQLESLNPQQIRALLRENGVPEGQLQGIDDATLVALYQKSLSDLKLGKRQLQNSDSSQSQGLSESELLLLTSPTSTTPQQIREFLKKSGRISEEQLQRIDDGTLKKLYLESLAEAQKK